MKRKRKQPAPPPPPPRPARLTIAHASPPQADAVRRLVASYPERGKERPVAVSLYPRETWPYHPNRGYYDDPRGSLHVLAVGAWQELFSHEWGHHWYASLSEVEQAEWVAHWAEFKETMPDYAQESATEGAAECFFVRYHPVLAGRPVLHPETVRLLKRWNGR